MISIKTDINSLQDIIQKIPTNLSILEKARLAYLEPCSRLIHRYDIKESEKLKLLF